jgi:hypothetical protein
MTGGETRWQRVARGHTPEDGKEEHQDVEDAADAADPLPARLLGKLEVSRYP